MSHLRKRSSKIATLEAARTIFFIIVGLAIRQSLGLFAHDWSPNSTNGPIWWTWVDRSLLGFGFVATALRYSHGVSQLYGYERDQVETSGLPSSSRILGLSLFLALLGILFYLMADNITRFSWFVVWTGLMLFVDFIYIALSQVVRNPLKRLIRWLPARIFAAIRRKGNSWSETVPGYAADAALEWMTSDVVIIGLCLLFLLVWNKTPHERLFASILILATIVDYGVNRDFYFGGKSDKRKQIIAFVCSPLAGNMSANAPKEAKETQFREHIKQTQTHCKSLMKDRTIIPFASHAFYPYFLNLLDQEDPTDMILSRYYGIAFLRACDAIYVYVPFTKQPLTNFLRFVQVLRPDLSQLPSGMDQELVEAKRLGLQIRYQRTDNLVVEDHRTDWAPPVYSKDAEAPHTLEDLDSIKRVYVCTPFRGANYYSTQSGVARKEILETNVRAALWYCRKLARDPAISVAPFAPQAFYPYLTPSVGQNMEGDNWFSRSLEILKICDAVYVYTEDGLPNKQHISVGMSHVIRLAETLGIEIQYKRSPLVPADWKPALPSFHITQTISDLPELAVPAEELKTVPTMGKDDLPLSARQKEPQDQAGIDAGKELAPSSEPQGEGEIKNTPKGPSLYFAAPLFTQAEWQWNDRLTAELVRLGMNVVLPQVRAFPMLKGEEKFDAQTLFTENFAALEDADVLLAVLDQPDPDSGTCWECGYAFKIGCPVIGLRTDIRGGGDAPGASVNLMLCQSSTEFIDVPFGERDDVGSVAVRVADAVGRIMKSRASDSE
jgi:nucleoside 2-deoxyribosyltransferase